MAPRSPEVELPEEAASTMPGDTPSPVAPAVGSTPGPKKRKRRKRPAGQRGRTDSSRNRSPVRKPPPTSAVVVAVIGALILLVGLAAILWLR